MHSCKKHSDKHNFKYTLENADVSYYIVCIFNHSSGCQLYRGTLFRQISVVRAKILAENRKQVQISVDEKRQHARLTSMRKIAMCVVAQDFPDCQHPISYAPRVSLSYDKVKTNIAGGSMSKSFLQATEFGSLTIKSYVLFLLKRGVLLCCVR